MGKLFEELKRRNVVRVGIAYLVLGWVTLQVGDILFDMFEAPVWVGKTFAGLLLLGLPFALLFAWAFELTPEGVKKTAEVDSSDSITHSTGRKLDFIVIAALAVALGYFIWDGQQAPNAESSAELDRSIAVLPFVNMSSDQEQEWFADGLTEEILNSLARTPDLLVASRTSSFQYKGQNQDISAIAKALGVAHILEGSVRRGGDRLRVTAQLIRASDGFHLWSETFDRKPEDVITIQEDVAYEIANALETAMDPEALKNMVAAGTASVAAYEAYLEGLVLTGQFGISGNTENGIFALRAFEKATAIDAEFGDAYAQQANFWSAELGITNIGQGGSGLSSEQILANFTSTIDAAIQNTSDSLEILKHQASKAIYELRYRDAIRYAEKYLSEYPYDIDVLGQLVQATAVLRDTATAERHIAAMLRMASDDPQTINNLLNNLLFTGLTDEAVIMARGALQRFPNHAFLSYQAHRALLWVGAVDEARELVEIVRRSEFPKQSINMMLLRQACAEGDREAADRIFSQLESDVDDVGGRFVWISIYGDPQKAHQVIVDANLGRQELASFLGYPYFDHNFFPTLVNVLEPQGISPPIIGGPPYACNTQPTT
jgi:TolB-like protein